jgi:quercetin 2,3-dioxygenase
MSIVSPNPPATAGGPTSRSATLVVDAVRQGRTFSSDESWVLLPPDVSRWDPFVLLVEDEFSTRGFPWHPHRGFQTLTYVLDGRLEHRDNAGGAGVLARGDAQYMVAGRYAMHYELAHELQPVRTLQAWINLPKTDKLGPTSYVELPHAAATQIERPGVTARLHAGPSPGTPARTPACSRSRSLCSTRSSGPLRPSTTRSPVSMLSRSMSSAGRSEWAPAVHPSGGPDGMVRRRGDGHHDADDRG